mmetsp:Transcript_23948/g.38517  ORF Transcript_23948/g.38517 Transcript_23948/m.38517 type:complete len:193 (+) Transcript_23948:189-767(+)
MSDQSSQEANTSLDNRSVSNKDRFDRLKESRQKYKDEADAAKRQCACLEEQVEDLQQRAENAGGGGDPPSGAPSEEERELRLKLKIAQEMVKRMEQQVASERASRTKCEASLAQSVEEVGDLKRALAEGAEAQAVAKAKAAEGAAAAAAAARMAQMSSSCRRRRGPPHRSRRLRESRLVKTCSERVAGKSTE